MDPRLCPRQHGFRIASRSLERRLASSGRHQACIHFFLQPRCASELEKGNLRDRINTRIELVDTALTRGNQVGNIDVDPVKWEAGTSSPVEERRACEHQSLLQESMDAVRKDFFSLNVKLRPRLFHLQPQPAAPPAAEPDNVSESSSPGQDFSATESLYLRMSGNAKGVLQVHRAPGLHCAVLDIGMTQATPARLRWLLKMPYKDTASCFGQKKYGFWPNASSNSPIGLPNCSSAWLTNVETVAAWASRTVQ